MSEKSKKSVLRSELTHEQELALVHEPPDFASSQRIHEKIMALKNKQHSELSQASKQKK